MKPPHFAVLAWVLSHVEESLVVSSLLRKVEALRQVTAGTMPCLNHSTILVCKGPMLWRLVLMGIALSKRVITVTDLLLELGDKELFLPLN